MKILSLCVFLLLVLSACTVSPWERGHLAKQEMLIIPNPQQAALMEHVYDSKEASSAGMMGSGGGCGCN